MEPQVGEGAFIGSAMSELVLKLPTVTPRSVIQLEGFDREGFEFSKFSLK